MVDALHLEDIQAVEILLPCTFQHTVGRLVSPIKINLEVNSDDTVCSTK